MAVAVLTPVQVTQSGLESHTNTGAYTAATALDGFEYVNDGNTIVEIMNGGTSGALTATVDSPQTCDQGGTHDLTVTIPQGDSFIIPRLATSRFNQNSSGKVVITLSHFDVVTARAYKV